MSPPSAVTLAPRRCLFLCSPGAGIFVVIGGFFFGGGGLLVSCFFSSICLGRRSLLWLSAKEMFWSCQEGRRRGVASPGMNGAPLPPPPAAPPCTVLGHKRSCFARALRPALCVVGLLSATTSPLLPAQALSPRGPSRTALRGGSGTGRPSLGGQPHRAGFQAGIPPRRWPRTQSGPGRGKLPCFRAATRVPALDHPHGH